ncbi:M48 family metallopeptidase [Lyngbya confervoides]|uniref:M48 family metallopeptidase n=1 Tax=Lyngbya confervoides BDU141951 TaxID=1574623 RepID=A0ABD4SZ66_9CYAN|nr:M48 family metallopeptidase [Lyngbya confervoides]MCM1981663.1 M48 family metallopeptidase [Lyngbya confervoides BDU141951]
MNSVRRSRHQQIAKRWMSVAVASVVLGSGSLPAQAISWRDFLFRGIQVIQLSNVSPRQEVSLGEQIHSNLQQRGMRLNRDRRLNSYVDQIGQRLSNSVSRSNIPYRFFVVQDDAVNAYATAGGFVYVTTGLMKLADNEAQLASVMAHEVGHIEEKHLIKQIRQATLAQGIAATALGTDRNVLANIGVELLVRRPQSREHEYDADRTGLEILRRAGYATSEAPRFMEKLLSGGRPPTFVSTHPAVSDRIVELRRQIAASPNTGCERTPIPASCGVNNAEYQALVRNRI